MYFIIFTIFDIFIAAAIPERTKAYGRKVMRLLGSLLDIESRAKVELVDGLHRKSATVFVRRKGADFIQCAIFRHVKSRFFRKGVSLETFRSRAFQRHGCSVRSLWGLTSQDQGCKSRYLVGTIMIHISVPVRFRALPNIQLGYSGKKVALGLPGHRCTTRLGRCAVKVFMEFYIVSRPFDPCSAMK